MIKPPLKRLLFLPLWCAALHAQTIAEKKAGSMKGTSGDLSAETEQILMLVNRDVKDLQQQLQNLYAEIQQLYETNAPPERYEELLVQINETKENIRSLENNWREVASSTEKEAGYALWHQPDSTIGQLINDYGSQSYIYVSTPEVSKLKISVDSNLPIPRSSWNEVLELILNQSGIGIKQLNPYLRELYFLDKDRSNPRLITNNRDELELFPNDAKVAFVLAPEPSELKRMWFFLEKFVNPSTTALQMVGRDILIIGKVVDIQELLRIYDFVSSNRGDKEYKAITIGKVDVDEMARILGAIFDSSVESPSGFAERRPEPPRGRPDGPDRPRMDLRPPSPRPSSQQEGNGATGLKVIPLKNIAQALFLVGTKEEIRKAEEIIQQVEEQVGEARAKVIYLYMTKHSDPEELAQILEKIYNLMISTGTGYDEGGPPPPDAGFDPALGPLPPPPPPIPLQPEIPLQPPRGFYDNGFFLTERFVVNGDQPRPPKPPANLGRYNFIVDPKTGALVMVVEADILPKMKDLLKKLDVPKKMVQLEVMLFEKRILRNEDIGLNLLLFGSAARNVNATSVLFRAGAFPERENFFQIVPLLGTGITDFIISRKESSGIPAFDAFYRFAISRDDITISATPSVLTVNQTEAIIEIQDQISVNTGTFFIPNGGTNTPERSFQRANYGIRVRITPTIHMAERESPFDDGENVNYVTLESDIKFETFVPDPATDRPSVTIRTIKNEARVADGQTVILGGLRRKDTQDGKRSIPFLGELPGIGKLFSLTAQADQSTEMFIFITPKIVLDACDDLERIKMEEMIRRPGDIPSYLCSLVAARERQRNQLFEGTMGLLFGRPPERCVDMHGCLDNGGACGEYDGR